MFIKPKSKALANKISIKNPTIFRQSIKRIKKGGITLHERRALILAKNIAKAQLKRKNLSQKERKQFRSISKIPIPKR